MTSAKPPKTELGDRTLWADGVSVVRSSELEQAILTGIPLSSLAVTELTAEVRRLNLLSDAKVGVKTELNPSVRFPPEWVIPEKYWALDVEEHLVELVNKLPGPADPTENARLAWQRAERLAQEIILFEDHKLIDLLRVLIYVVDRLRETNTVWGVGRGSSCSSFILYLIGLHAVDPVKYDIPITDFIR